MANEPATAPGQSLSTSVLTRRLMTGLLAAVPAFVLVRHVALAVVSVSELVAMAIAAGAALTVAAIVLARTVAPVLAQQAVLEERYEAALADALTDPLTGLGNHRAFHEELDRQVASALRYETQLALVLVDLDEFKQVNDQGGHAAGDRMLRAFAQVLRSSVRRMDRPFRVGGDEFAVILPHTDAAGAHVVARRVLAQALGPSIRVEASEPVSFSAGVSAIPELATDRSTLYSQADTALYAAKRGGRTDVVTYSPMLSSDHAETSGAASAAIADVIARGLLRPVYQPIVRLATREILGVEGLIRPVDPAPFSNPGELFAAAAAGGRLVALDLACVETIVRGAAHLPDDQFLSVNLSPATVEAPEFNAGALLAILARHGFPASRLVIELTEHEAVHDPARVRQRLDTCREAGVRLAADDIGAGNAGLRLLAEISFDVLKVDLGLVQRSAAGGSASAVLGSVVGLATRIGALVIAEGIEEPTQVDQLVEAGVEAGQGYHLGYPGPLEETAPQLEPVPVGVAAWRQSIGLPSA